MKNKRINFNLFAVGLFVSFLIITPLLTHGYVQTFDMPWGTNPYTVTPNFSTWTIWSLLKVFSVIIGSIYTQKLLIVTIILLTVTGINRVVSIAKHSSNLKLSFLPIILYVFNPYFYSRLIVGQWTVLLGYAILPWAIAYWWKFLPKPSFKTAWPVVAWAAAIGLTSIHTIGIFALAAVVMALYSGKQNVKAKLKWSAAIAGGFLLINSIWLVPLLAGQSQTSQNISSFSSGEFQAFATQGTVGGSVPLSAALLTGFWADNQNRYILPSALPIWYIGVVIIATLVIAGLIKVWRQKDRLGMALATSGFIAWLLGMGLAWGGSAWLTNALLHILPFYNGYREPQKWLMLLALAYAYLAAVGAAAIYARLKTYSYKPAANIFMAVALLAPFLFAPSLAWGAAGQLKSVDYPAGWYQAKDYLNAQNLPKDAQILSLPWHLYIPLDFTGRVVANPSNYFFDQNFVVGNNFELRGVPTRDSSPLQTYVNYRLVPLTSEHRNIGTNLHKYGVDYVMLLKQADWRQYNWLNNQPDLPIALENDSLILYKVSP